MSQVATIKERPILFSAPPVRSILAGTKTLTRRVCKLDVRAGMPEPELASLLRCCPYGQPGDRLWVRETWMDLQGTGVERRTGDPSRYAYGAESPPGSYGDEARKDYGLKWRPSIHMPRGASRITLEVTGVGIERLQDISEQDAIAEGVERVVIGDGWRRYADAASEAAGLTPCKTAMDSFRSLWEQINGPDSWGANPWVWVLGFRRIEAVA